jgi:hypothetical protein
VGHYLVNVGPHDENLSGVASRGYWIRRRGSVVYRTWGPIDVDGIRGGRFYWRAGRRDLVDDLGTPAAAAAFLRQKVKEKLEYADGGYRRLPPPNKIW